MSNRARSGISAIVLAAGSSSRMGSIKPLVHVGGQAMLARVLGTIRESRVDEIIVVLGYSATLIQERISLDGVKVVFNESYQEGMATSIRLGLANVSEDAEAALIILADQPFIRASTIDILIEEYQRNKPEIVIPVYNGFRGNPVLLDRSVFGEVAALSGDIGCRAIFGNHSSGILKVAVHDEGVLIDLDTAAEVQRFEEGRQQCDVVNSGNRAGAGPQLVLVGQDPVAKALAMLGRLLDLSVVLVDPFVRPDEVHGASVLNALDLSRLAKTDDTAVVVTSRGRFDEDAIEQALNMEAAYVGLLASNRRAKEIRSNLRAKGVTGEKLAKLRAPAGLDIGAVTPAEIAISIMAEVVSRTSGAERTGTPTPPRTKSI
ncbi:MAG: NTP transferase domain-containing protein [Acidobacteriaceae bacterium]|nr:NTP transferase domain-containing protein [Acidobacteriaceae bacterium]